MAHRTNVLVGTQMIAKGLDLPLVTLVGIISGDTALGLPDYRANERTFQLLTQVSGRAGRGPMGGHVILQTYQPEHYAIQAAAEHDFKRFYEREIEYRNVLRWPPFVRLARVLVQHRIPEEARAEAEAVANRLKERIESLELTATELVGPVPCFFGKLDNLFRWHVLVRTLNPVALFDQFDLSTTCMLDIDPVDIL
jgi:primosomal protein N' (replication factor Y)